jgi:hypothetical protein
MGGSVFRGRGGVRDIGDGKKIKASTAPGRGIPLVNFMATR